MSTSDRLRKILVPTPQLTTCRHCGEVLSSIEGRVFDNCADWSEFAGGLMYQPVSFSMFLPIILMRKLCRLETMIKRQIAAVNDDARR